MFTSRPAHHQSVKMLVDKLEELETSLLVDHSMGSSFSLGNSQDIYRFLL